MPLWSLTESDSEAWTAADVAATEEDNSSPANVPERVGSFLQASSIGLRLRSTLEDFLTFKDCQELLRATTLATVMHQGCHLFSTPAGSRDTHSLSRVVDGIDVFLSHNWSTPRHAKFLTLVYEYNFGGAIWVMLLACMAITIASSCSDALAVPDKTIEPELSRESGHACGCKLLSVPIFFVALFLGRDVAKCFGKPGPTLFLDKCCINQVDRTAQQHGIRKLGAFLSKSQKMFVLYSDTYLQKLWTIYEIASFLAIHDLRHLKIVPVSQPQTLFVLIAFWELYHVLIVALRIFEDFDYFAYALCIIGGFGIILTVRAWERDKAEIQKRVRNFVVQDATCANEADRPLVYFNIQCLMQGKGLVAPGCSMDEALETFNNLVRTTLPYAFLSMEGSRMFKFRDYLLFGFVADGVEGLDWFATLYLRGQPFRIILAESLYRVIWLAVWPSLMAVLELVCSYKMFLRGWREKVWLGLWLLLVFAVSAMFNEITNFMRVEARESDLSLALLFCLIPVVWAVCVGLCSSWRAPAAPPVDDLRHSSTDLLSIASIKHLKEDDEDEGLASI
mmetsp:Transcript_54022/g.115360  ORF Transcript_54022/g.115360 Transcript_54022/m.115360 type:complete len:563 (+) Transcript_54022:133-1821(+)